MKKVAFFQVVTVCLLSLIIGFNVNVYGQARLNSEIEQLYRSSNGRLSMQGALFLQKNYVPHREPCEKVSDVGGWYWKCVYADGLVVFNCFRKCRGTVEVAQLFLGLNSNTDCDSYTMVNGERKKICYPGQAAAIFQYHGAVIAIQQLNECRE
jgi:hypothetical protein